MYIRTFKCFFSGSFQCRLATDPAPPAGTVAAPPSPADFSLGWTFDFGEPPLDRIIRLSRPLSLRQASILPWRDTVVMDGETDRPGFGILPVAASDPLLQSAVSLGTAAKFDAAAGGGAGKERILGFELGFGNLFKSKGNPDPICKSTFTHPFQSAWMGVYRTLKPQRITSLSASVRQAHISHPDTQFQYAHFYSAMGIVDGWRLQTPSISATQGVLAELKNQITPRNSGVWKVDITFFQFDGDTLTGEIFGTLSASF